MRKPGVAGKYVRLMKDMSGAEGGRKLAEVAIWRVASFLERSEGQDRTRV